MGADAQQARGRFSRFLGIFGVIVLVLFIIAVVVGIFALVMRGRQARRGAAPGALRLTGPDPSARISDIGTCRLRVYGKVGKELALTYADVQALPAVQTDAPLACVVGWEDHAVWRGARIRNVIAAAQPTPEARFLVFHDDRNFSATLSMDYVESGTPLLAYEVDGKPLPREHGWPLRIVAPDRWGYKWVKWVTSIELQDRGYEGTYESEGFSLDGDLSGPKLESEKHGK